MTIDIEALAVGSGLIDDHALNVFGDWVVSIEGEAAIKLRAFAAAVLEEAAKLAEAERWNTAALTSMPPQSSAAFNIAAAIRAEAAKLKGL